MQIGIIGISGLTLELASRSAKAGNTVRVHNPRGNSLVSDAIENMGKNVMLATLEEAASAVILLLFLAKEMLDPVLKKLPDMSGKVIVYTSGLAFDPQNLLSGIINEMTYKTTALLLPTAYVVKLFNTVPQQTIPVKEAQSKKQEIFFIAEHPVSRNIALAFLKKLHFNAFDLSDRYHLLATNAKKKQRSETAAINLRAN
jgi:predicted dinucleotide-binding enzyme